MNRFKIVKKGYDVNEVERYIKENVSDVLDVNNKQKIIISELNKKIDDLTSKLEELRKKEDLIAKTLESSIEKAENIEYASKIRFALEGERIKSFQEKWEGYINKVISKLTPEVIESMNKYFEDINVDIYEMFKNEFLLESSS